MNKNRQPANLVPASTITDLYVALWALRLVLHNPYTNLLKRDADDFLDFTNKHLSWSPAAFEKFLESINLEREEVTQIREMGFKHAWMQYRKEYEFPFECSLINNLKVVARQDKSLIISLAKRSIKVIERKIRESEDPVKNNIKLLQQIVGLNDAEAGILHLAAMLGRNQLAIRLSQLIEINSFDECVQTLAAMLGVDSAQVETGLMPDSLLRQYHLISLRTTQADLRRWFIVPESVHNCLYGKHASAEEMIKHFATPTKISRLSQEDYPHMAEDQNYLSRYLRGSLKSNAAGVNIMFYGIPGTGKTEFAKVLAEASGLSLYEVPSAGADGSSLSRSDRLTSLRLSQRILRSDHNSLLLFDEIEDVFPSAAFKNDGLDESKPNDLGKAWMNNLLENNNVPVIWVSNAITQIDPAYLRRFSYHLEFSKPPLSVRQRIAEKYLQETPVGDDFIQSISLKPDLSPALIECAGRVVSLSSITSRSDAENLASRVIKHCHNAMGLDSQSHLRPAPTEYNLEYLNIESRFPIEQIIAGLKRTPTSTMCFYGMSGTGKTALAEHLARELDRPLLIKRASDLLSKWVGDSEKNIAKMFKEAELEGSILFLDEADSMLRNRESASRNWEISQVNELLQHMERFNGLFICATNLISNIDNAAMRRFAFKLLFKPLTMSQKERMFIREALWGDSSLLTDAMVRRLEQLDSLVPGDFAVVKRQSAMLGMSIPPDDFLNELESECKVKGHKKAHSIGFTA